MTPITTAGTNDPSETKMTVPKTQSTTATVVIPAWSRKAHCPSTESSPGPAPGTVYSFSSASSFRLPPAPTRRLAGSRAPRRERCRGSIGDRVPLGSRWGGVVHEEQGDAVVGAQVAGGEVLAVAAHVGERQGVGVEYVDEAGRAAAVLSVGPAGLVDRREVEPVAGGDESASVPVSASGASRFSGWSRRAPTLPLP